MPRNMSFMLTTQQILNQTKTVTRRLGWKFLKPGDILNACEKCQGIKKGDKIKTLCQIRVLTVIQEPLCELMRNAEYGRTEAAKEGFPDLNGKQFVKMFCDHMRPLHGCIANVTRIEFSYIDPPQSKTFFLNETHELPRRKTKRTRTRS